MVSRRTKSRRRAGRAEQARLGASELSCVSTLSPSWSRKTSWNLVTSPSFPLDLARWPGRGQGVRAPTLSRFGGKGGAGPGARRRQRLIDWQRKDKTVKSPGSLRNNRPKFRFHGASISVGARNRYRARPARPGNVSPSRRRHSSCCTNVARSSPSPSGQSTRTARNSSRSAVESRAAAPGARSRSRAGRRCRRSRRRAAWRASSRHGGRRRDSGEHHRASLSRTWVRTSGRLRPPGAPLAAAALPAWH